MKREIKFRAFTHGEMLPVLLIDFVNDSFYVLPESELEGGTQQEIFGLEKLMQYTGLKDVNGKEIYEGDIVSHGTFTNTIKYFKSAFCLYDEQRDEYFIFHQPEDTEVIGNIYENPELL